MTVIPLFCSRFLKIDRTWQRRARHMPRTVEARMWTRFTAGFNRGFNKVLDCYEALGETRAGSAGGDGDRTRRAVHRESGDLSVSGSGVLSRDRCRAVHGKREIADGITNRSVRAACCASGKPHHDSHRPGLQNDSFKHRYGARLFSPLYEQFRTVYGDHSDGLKDEHEMSSFEAMARVREAIGREFPDVRTFFQSGSMVDATLNSRHAGADRCADHRAQYAAGLSARTATRAQDQTGCREWMKCIFHRT